MYGWQSPVIKAPIAAICLQHQVITVPAGRGRPGDGGIKLAGMRGSKLYRHVRISRRNGTSMKRKTRTSRLAVACLSGGVLLMLFEILASSARPLAGGTATLRVTTVSYGGKYAEKNAGVAWVQDAQDRFVKTLNLWASKRKGHLIKWNTASSGNVIDAVTGATARAHVEHVVTWNCTDVNGITVPDGKYRIYVEFTEDNSSSSGNPPGKWTMVEFTKGASAQTVRPPNQTYFINMELVYQTGAGDPAPAALSGTVKDAGTNALLAGVPLQLKVGTQVVRDTTTNTAGQFQLLNIPPASYTLAATKSGYQNYAETLTFTAGQQLIGKSVLLQPLPAPASVSGTVRNARTNAGLSGALVQLRAGGQVRYEVSTNSTGAYNLADVQSGTYAFTVLKDGFVSWSENLALAAGQNLTGKNVALVPIANGASLSGQVLTARTSQPIANATVQLRSGDQVQYEKNSDGTGVYTFADIPAGSYTLWAAKTGFVTRSEPIALSAGQQITGQDLVLTRAAVRDTIPPPTPPNVRVEIVRP